MKLASGVSGLSNMQVWTRIERRHDHYHRVIMGAAGQKRRSCRPTWANLTKTTPLWRDEYDTGNSHGSKYFLFPFPDFFYHKFFVKEASTEYSCAIHLITQRYCHPLAVCVPTSARSSSNTTDGEASCKKCARQRGTSQSTVLHPGHGHILIPLADAGDRVSSNIIGLCTANLQLTGFPSEICPHEAVLVCILLVQLHLAAPLLAMETRLRKIFVTCICASDSA